MKGKQAVNAKTGWKGIKHMDLATWKAMRICAMKEDPPLELADLIKKMWEVYEKGGKP